MFQAATAVEHESMLTEEEQDIIARLAAASKSSKVAVQLAGLTVRSGSCAHIQRCLDGCKNVKAVLAGQEALVDSNLEQQFRRDLSRRTLVSAWFC